VRSYRECSDFLEGAHWAEKDTRFWLSADDLDEPDPELGYETQLYGVDAVGYESLMIGMLAIHKGPPNSVCEKTGFPKITELTVAYSREGIHWQRPDRSAFVACSRKPGTWNRGYVHSAGGVYLIVGDELWFYFGAWSGISPKFGAHMYAGGSTGLAILRRDGFVSLDAGPKPGTLTTRPVVFRGRHLFVNVNAQSGQLRAEVLDTTGKVIEPFSLGQCISVRRDGTIEPIIWKHEKDLSFLGGTPVVFRFHLTNGQLYSFWITPDRSGASRV
jgi:hypothetical protein